MDGYLKALGMELRWQSFSRMSLQRIVQLANKTNQFNLTTQRYTEADVLALMASPDCLTLQLRLVDSYGDNGIIGLVAGRDHNGTLDIEMWLMSCRVLGRRVEEAALAIVAGEALRLGCDAIVGTYRPTAKNGMVQQHYAKLGFTLLQEQADGGTRWQLPLHTYVSPSLPFDIKKGDTCKTQTSIAV